MAASVTPYKVDQEEGWSAQVRAIRAWNRRLLFSTLDLIEGEKTIIWSESLMSRLNVFANKNELIEHGVIYNGILDKKPQSNSPNILFFIEKSMTEANKLIDYLGTVKNENSFNHVFFIPEEWYAARQKLKEQKNIWDKLETVRALPLSWLPYEGDIISLEEPTLSSRLLLNGDWTVLHRCACALYELERMVGKPLIIHTKGKWSQDISNMIVKMRKNDSNNENSMSNDSSTIPLASGLRINRLVIIDRWIDPIAPLITPVTYAAMLDDVYGIRLKDTIKIPEIEYVGIDNTNAPPDALKEIQLNDELFHRLKHVHITQLGSEICDMTADLKRDEEKSKEQMSLAEYHLFVKRLPAFVHRKGRLSQHMRLNELLQDAMNMKYDETVIERDLLLNPISDKVISSIEDMIISGGSSLDSSLRLIVIQSITAEGLKSSILQTYRKLVFQSFGVDALNRFLKMQKIGLIREKSGPRFTPMYAPMCFGQQRKEYNLVSIDGVDGRNPTDSAYAFNYYSSLVVRMIEEGVKIKWVGWHKPQGNLVAEQNGDGIVKEDEIGSTVVFIVGGITRAEVAGIRLLKNIGLISSSSIITKDSAINSFTNIL